MVDNTLTERLEKIIEREAERFRDNLRASTSNVRPLGSTPLSHPHPPFGASKSITH